MKIEKAMSGKKDMEIESLRQQLAEAKKDAERMEVNSLYSLIRSFGYTTHDQSIEIANAIDTAMRGDGQ